MPANPRIVRTLLRLRWADGDHAHAAYAGRLVLRQRALLPVLHTAGGGGGGMPRLALRPCAAPGCCNLVEHGRCPEHRRRAWRDDTRERGTPDERGYDRDWRRCRAAYLAEHPLCEDCEQRGRVVPAEQVHHVESIERAPHRRLEWRNLRALCVPCHEKRTHQ